MSHHPCFFTWFELANVSVDTSRACNSSCQAISVANCSGVAILPSSNFLINGIGAVSSPWTRVCPSASYFFYVYPVSQTHSKQVFRQDIRRNFRVFGGLIRPRFVGTAAMHESGGRGTKSYNRQTYTPQSSPSHVKLSQTSAKAMHLLFSDCAISSTICMDAWSFGVSSNRRKLDVNRVPPPALPNERQLLIPL
eukprot:6354130-Amphidinium_carterae.1